MGELEIPCSDVYAHPGDMARPHRAITYGTLRSLQRTPPPLPPQPRTSFCITPPIAAKLYTREGSRFREATLECCVATRKLGRAATWGAIVFGVSRTDSASSRSVPRQPEDFWFKIDTFLKVQFPVYHSWSRI